MNEWLDAYDDTTEWEMKELLFIVLISSLSILRDVSGGGSNPIVTEITTKSSDSELLNPVIKCVSLPLLLLSPSSNLVLRM